VQIEKLISSIVALFLFLTTFALAGCGASEKPLSPSAVQLPNCAPRIDQVISQNTANISAPVEITCKAIDPDGDLLAYSWAASSGNITGSGPTIIWISPPEPGAYSVTANVTDGKGGEDSKTITINITSQPVSRPEISRIQVTKMDHTELTVLPGDIRPIMTRPWNVITLECLATDKDNGDLSYQWKTAGGKIEGVGSLIKFVPVEKEGMIVSVTVTNKNGLFAKMDIYFYADCCGHYPAGAREY
jgi:hypothetical protein